MRVTPHSLWAQIPFGGLHSHGLVDLSTCLNVTGSFPPSCQLSLAVSLMPRVCQLGLHLAWTSELLSSIPTLLQFGSLLRVPCPLVEGSQWTSQVSVPVCLWYTALTHPVLPTGPPPPRLQVFARAPPFSSSHLCPQCPLSSAPPQSFLKGLIQMLALHEAFHQSLWTNTTSLSNPMALVGTSLWFLLCFL